eukprot:jgi/Orpsp1_1/1190902/evm.model.d7180000082015.1
MCFNMKNENTGKFPNGYYYNNEILDSEQKVKNTLYEYSIDDQQWNVINLNEIKNCTYNSYKDNTCFIDFGDDENIRYSANNPKIEAGKICKSLSKLQIYFSISEINTGIDEINCIELPQDKNVKYYNISGNAYGADKFSFYQIDGNNVIDNFSSKIISKELSISNGIIKKDDDALNEYMIHCNSGECKNLKTVFCNYDFKTETCKLISGSISVGQTCTSLSSNIIYLALSNINSSSSGKCIPYTKNRSLSNESQSVEIEYNDRKYVYSEINEKLYYFNSKFEVYYITENGIYIIDKWNYKIKIKPLQLIKIEPYSDYTIYICKEGKCKKKDRCENGKLYEYIFDSSTQSIYQCNPLNNNIKIINDIGYYVNSLENNLIECYIDYNHLTKCINKTDKNGMEGYYLNKGNNNKIIKCVRDESSFNCIEEDIIKCNYDFQNNACNSNKDLERNSYCYYSKEKTDSSMGKLVYIENFIKSGDYGDCIILDGNNSINDNIYIKYKNSKFMGHSERDELIVLNSDYIVSIYEEEIGYYIISTDSRKGIDKDTTLNKSLMYKCEKQNCVEMDELDNIGDIYVNKASLERMVRYSDGKWNIINHSCKIKYYGDSNESQCALSSNVDVGDIIYVTILIPFILLYYN